MEKPGLTLEREAPLNCRNYMPTKRTSLASQPHPIKHFEALFCEPILASDVLQLCGTKVGGRGGLAKVCEGSTSSAKVREGSPRPTRGPRRFANIVIIWDPRGPQILFQMRLM